MDPRIDICMADDHPLYLKGVKDYLLNFNINVTVEAQNGKQLIDALNIPARSIHNPPLNNKHILQVRKNFKVGEN